MYAKFTYESPLPPLWTCWLIINIKLIYKAYFKIYKEITNDHIHHIWQQRNIYVDISKETKHID